MIKKEHLTSPEKHRAFLASPKKHLLMITNHGIHQWQVVPGLPDTGGQNIFVNQFAEALTKFGFKITIANRGGYPHPITKKWQRGLHYKNDALRILYLEDDQQNFVRKEDMAAQIPLLAASLKNFLNAEQSEIDLIISHYWDAAELGVLYKQISQKAAKHVWVPHSLGAVKKQNVSPARWSDLRIDERIETERRLMPQLDGVAATSSTIRQSLQDDYKYTGPDLFLPPCIDTTRYHPRQIPDRDAIWNFLSQHSGLSPAEVRNCKIVAEISRTDTTKRKNVLIEAFAKARQHAPNSLLVVSIDDTQERLGRELRQLIKDCNVETHTAVTGSVWDILPTLYAVTDVYCTPSVMEGFGMSAQEAAATGVPVIASDLVPFAEEYLLGSTVKLLRHNETRPPLQQGSGAIVVPADDVDGFAHALTMLLSDDALRKKMGQNAYRATIPYFTWDKMVALFLEETGAV